MEDCCKLEINKRDQKNNGFLRGVMLGILPHSFCIAFIIFSVIGATFTASLFKKFLLLPYFFEILAGISFLFATLSAGIYLKRLKILSVSGIKSKSRYLLILYGTTMAVSLLFFFVIFPWTANLGLSKNAGSAVLAEKNNFSTMILEVQIPCSGHAPLISDELKKLPGIGGIKFQLPNRFVVDYDSSKVNPSQITSIDIFKSFPVKIVN